MPFISCRALNNTSSATNNDGNECVVYDGRFWYNYNCSMDFSFVCEFSRDFG